MPCRFPLHGVTAGGHDPKVPVTTGSTPASCRELHTRSLLAVPGACSKVPATHMRHGVHDDALVVLEKVPIPQGLHSRLLAALPVVCTKVPAGHVVHDMQEVALKVEKVPGAHALHEGASVVFEKVPAGQGLQKRSSSGVPTP